MNFTFFRKRSEANALAPPRVTLIQWILAVLPLVGAFLSLEFTSYTALAVICQSSTALGLLLLLVVAFEALRTRLIGKACLVASVFVFFWMDAFALSLQSV